MMWSVPTISTFRNFRSITGEQPSADYSNSLKSNGYCEKKTKNEKRNLSKKRKHDTKARHSSQALVSSIILLLGPSVFF